MPEERVMVFIDGSNILHTSQSFRSGTRLDYKKLVDKLVNGRRLIRPYFFCSHTVPPSDIQIGFQKRLRLLGFTVVSKPLQMRERQDRKIWIEKGVDVALVTYLISMGFKNAFDTAIIVSGDNDYVDAMNEVKSLGKRVEVSAFNHATGREIKMTADRFTALDDIIDEIVEKQ